MNAGRLIALCTVVAAVVGGPALAQPADPGAPGNVEPRLAPPQDPTRPEIRPPAAPAPDTPAGPAGAPPPAVPPFARELVETAAEKASSGAFGDALAAFYGAPDAAPLWVDATGLLARATAAAAELARAGDYGLEPGAYAVPPLGSQAREPGDLAAIELALSRAAIAYVRDAWGGRVERAKIGTQLPEPPALPGPADILRALKAAADPAAYLRAQHPSHPQFEALRQQVIALRGRDAARPPVRLPDGPILRRGDDHAQVDLLRRRLGLAAGGETAGFDEALEQALKAFQTANGLAVDGVLGPGTRAALNAATSDKARFQLLINLERWRWLPRPLDAGTGIYVWANIPEFRVRVVQNGKTVFDERAIVGKVDKQTPVFSDRMEWIEIHPTWYVPNSIKVEDILPSLRRNTSRIMTRYHLRMDCGRLGRDPARVDWNNVDIRKCSFSQPPGEKSVLGDFKFKFPNKHDVYMHDTLTRRLFQTNPRAYSHGCVRVKNPQRLAEILLAHDKDFSADRLAKILAGPKRLHKEVLNAPVPVHMTYFTARMDETGKPVWAPDYYGHDRRLADVLYGKGSLFPAARLPGRRVVKTRRPPPERKREWWESVMQN